MKATDAIQDLCETLERALGFELGALKRIGNQETLNFKAVRASDGLPFLVKCVPSSRRSS